jgi:hypothetical protein
MVDDLNDGGESALVWPIAEECDAANLYILPLACRDLCVAHLAECVQSIYPSGQLDRLNSGMYVVSH